MGCDVPCAKHAPGMDDEQTLWHLGDPWLDLLPLLPPNGPVTVVSAHGTATILDAGTGWHRRIPLEGGHRLPGDGERWRYDQVLCATPCGVNISSSNGWWHRTSRLILVAAGAHPRWLDSTLGRDVYMQVIRSGWSAPEHPPGPRGALHCMNGTIRLTAGSGE